MCALKPLATSLTAVSLFTSCFVDCTRPATFGRRYRAKELQSSEAVAASFEAGLMNGSKHKRCCCNSLKPGLLRKCEIRQTCAERIGKFGVIQPLELCHIKEIRIRIHNNIDTAGWVVDQLNKDLKRVKQHYPAGARVDHLRIQKADECTRKYKKTHWPVELKDANGELGTKRDGKKKKAHAKEVGFLEEPASLLDLKGHVRNSSITSGSRSSGWKMCCCKILFADEKYKQGQNEGELGSAEACQKQWKCQGSNSKFPQTTNEMVCKFGELMGRLQDTVKGLKGNAMDAEAMYSKYPGWQAISVARNLGKCLDQIKIPDLKTVSNNVDKNDGEKVENEEELQADVLEGSAQSTRCFVPVAVIGVAVAVLAVSERL